ncbi:hypothetical protein BDV06DRAFT_196336 [Aspergillus oleicola]
MIYERHGALFQPLRYRQRRSRWSEHLIPMLLGPYSPCPPWFVPAGVTSSLVHPGFLSFVRRDLSHVGQTF